MDYEKLVEQMKWWAEECDRTNFGCQAKKTLQEAANALSMLQAENEKLQKMYQEEKVICHETQLELERMKKIMREDEVMVAPSEYPGSQKMEYSEVMRSEGGIVK